MRYDDYDSKQAFKQDLQRNGYTVIRISNKRDMECQNTMNYESFSKAFPKFLLDIWTANPDLFDYELAEYHRIKNIEL